MSRPESPAVARLDLETLGTTGPPTQLACGACGKPTRSHILVDDGGAWREFDDPGQLDDVPPVTAVRFALVCHTCRTALPLPATGSDHDTVADALDDESEAVFQAVVA